MPEGEAKEEAQRALAQHEAEASEAEQELSELEELASFDKAELRKQEKKSLRLEEVRHGIEMMPEGTPEERQSKEQAMQTFLRDLQDGSDDELDVMEAGEILTLTLIGIVSTT